MIKTANIYLTNKELLSEIHISKMTYVEVDDPAYYYYDTIIYDLEVLSNDEVCTEHYGEWLVNYIPKDKTEAIDEVITNLWAFKKHKDAPKRTVNSITLSTPKTTEEFLNDVKAKKAKKYNKSGLHEDKITADDIMTGELVIYQKTKIGVKINQRKKPPMVI